MSHTELIGFGLVGACGGSMLISLLSFTFTMCSDMPMAPVKGALHPCNPSCTSITLASASPRNRNHSSWTVREGEVALYSKFKLFVLQAKCHVNGSDHVLFQAVCWPNPFCAIVI